MNGGDWLMNFACSLTQIFSTSLSLEVLKNVFSQGQDRFVAENSTPDMNVGFMFRLR